MAGLPRLILHTAGALVLVLAVDMADAAPLPVMDGVRQLEQGEAGIVEQIRRSGRGSRTHRFSRLNDRNSEFYARAFPRTDCYYSRKTRRWDC